MTFALYFMCFLKHPDFGKSCMLILCKKSEDFLSNCFELSVKKWRKSCTVNWMCFACKEEQESGFDTMSETVIIRSYTFPGEMETRLELTAWNKLIKWHLSTNNTLMKRKKKYSCSQQKWYVDFISKIKEHTIDQTYYMYMYLSL